MTVRLAPVLHPGLWAAAKTPFVLETRILVYTGDPKSQVSVKYSQIKEPRLAADFGKIPDLDFTISSIDQA